MVLYFIKNILFILLKPIYISDFTIYNRYIVKQGATPHKEPITMAKFSITRSCGHTETINIGGKQSDRARQAEYEATKLCYDCYKAAQAAKQAQANEAAKISANEAGLPALQGSEKQIAWAETLRNEKIAEIKKLREVGIKPTEPAFIIEAVNNCFAKIENETSAKWFIDNRNQNVQHLISDACIAAMKNSA